MKQITAKNITLIFDSTGTATEQVQIQIVVDLINSVLADAKLECQPQIVQEAPRKKQEIINQIISSVKNTSSTGYVNLNEPVTYEMIGDNTREVVKVYSDGKFVDNRNMMHDLQEVNTDDLDTILDRIIDNDPNDEEVA